jgi:uncharacterized protein YrzB (UPF0473 family)
MEDQPGNVITLIDEKGNEVDFDLVMTFDYEKKRYAALLPMDKVEGVGEDEVVLLEVVTRDGEQNYVSIDNPILLDEVFEEFSDLFEDMMDQEDGDGEE